MTDEGADGSNVVDESADEGDVDTDGTEAAEESGEETAEESETADPEESEEVSPERRIEELEAELEERHERIESLEATLDDHEERIDDLTGRLQRKQADFENYKKRADRRREQEKARATEELVARLLDVRDNLTRALEQDGADVEALREGVKLTLSEFDRVLDAENVHMIEPDSGDEVDPERHEVLMTVEGESPEGTVADVHRPGYEMAGRVLREAQVTVSDGSGADEETDAERADDIDERDDER